MDQKSQSTRKILRGFDEAAWATLTRLFESPIPEHNIEAMRFWGKYRLVPEAMRGRLTPAAEKRLEAIKQESRARVFEGRTDAQIGSYFIRAGQSEEVH